MSTNYPWRTGRCCIFKTYYHLVFVTKYRCQVFNLAMIKRLQIIFNETCLQMESELLEFSGEHDPVHLMLTLPPKLALANLIGKLKGKSAFFLRKEYHQELKSKLWGSHLWSPSYCAVTCGGAPLEIVKKYIEQQRRPALPNRVASSIRVTKAKILSG